MGDKATSSMHNRHYEICGEGVNILSTLRRLSTPVSAIRSLIRLRNFKFFIFKNIIYKFYFHMLFYRILRL